MPVGRNLRVGAFVVTSLLAAGTVLHLPAVGKWFHRAGFADSGCPWSAESGAPGAEASSGAALLRGTGAALHSRVLGLGLNEADASDVGHWIRGHGLRCRPRSKRGELACATSNPAEVASTFDAATELNVAFTFASDNKLRRVQVMAHYPQAQQAAAAAKEILAVTEAQAGRASAHFGEYSADYLQGGLLRQSRTSFRRSNLHAELSATNFGNHFAVVHDLQIPL